MTTTRVVLERRIADRPRAWQRPSFRRNGRSIGRWSTTTTSSIARPTTRCRRWLLANAKTPVPLPRPCLRRCERFGEARQGNRRCALSGHRPFRAGPRSRARRAEPPCLAPCRSSGATSRRRWRAREMSADVAWIGLSLHHYRAPDKLRLMRAARDTRQERRAPRLRERQSRRGNARTNGWRAGTCSGRTGTFNEAEWVQSRPTTST